MPEPPEIISKTAATACVMPFLGSDGTPSWTIIAGAALNSCTGNRWCQSTKPFALSAVDVPMGEPATSAAHYESDIVPFKPRADVLCIGKAFAPTGAAKACVVSFGVGSWNKEILVIGDRQWTSKLGGLTIGISEPAPFQSMPISFHNAYGGHDGDTPKSPLFYEGNPFGKGFTLGGQRLHGLPMPNLEDPTRQIKTWRDRVIPRSFGPVGRTWQPRLARAGTYDENWIKTRAKAPGQLRRSLLQLRCRRPANRRLPPRR